MGNPDPNWKPQSLGVDLTVVERLTLAGQTPKQLGERRQVVILQKDQKLETIPALHEVPLPDHIRQVVKIVELESFVAYVKQFATATTRIFGSIGSNAANFTAILNYHEGGKEARPQHSSHKANYSPPFSEEFAAWFAGNAKLNTQETLLEHIRRWGFVITSHTEADLIELISSLEFSSQGQFASKIERTRGGRELTYNETVEGQGQMAGKKVTVPDGIVMKLPIFQGGKEYEVAADLLYRVQSGRLSIAWELKRVQKVIGDAVKDLVKDVEAGTGISVFVGSPTNES